VAARGITKAALANAANLNRVWVEKAHELGLITTRSLDGEDVIVVQVLAVVDQIVWPGERRSRSVSRTMDLWQSLAVNTAREAVGDPRTNPATVLWIMQHEVRLTHNLGERAAFVVDELGNRPTYMAPIGEWVSSLPPGFELPNRRSLSPDKLLPTEAA